MTLSSPIRNGTLEYRPAIDGLRALAVLSVFIFHLNQRWLPGGYLGVDVFFVISGYLITSIIFRECRSNSFTLAKFYHRRVARIFPAFFTVALATLGGAALIYSAQDFASAGANFAAAVLSFANMKYMLLGDYFSVSPDAQPFLHYWSLSVEEQFYMLFPLFFILVFKHARQQMVLILSGLCLLSFMGCLVMAWFNPVWAFYLLPTRGWELLAGGLLAVRGSDARPEPERIWPGLLSVFSLGLVALSFFTIREGSRFAACLALLPVAGAVGVLNPGFGNQAVSEKWLAAAPLVLVGRMSYSLYLWHWPVFSLIDYKMYFSSETVRLPLKIGLSFIAAALSFWFVENPARVYLNRHKHMMLAFGSLACAIAFCVPLGIALRRTNYINAEVGDVAKGGLVFEDGNKTNCLVLMGDSNGSMYGTVLRDVCRDLGFKFVVLSVAGGDPLPSSNRVPGRLWSDSIAVVRRQRPDFVVLACNWEVQLMNNKERLARALTELSPLVKRLIILNQPPLLPEKGTRASIREGARPPFYEERTSRIRRETANAYIKQFNVGHCLVVDVASHFERVNGEIVFLDGEGRQLYQDQGHLSGFGASLIRPDLIDALIPAAKANLE